MRDNIQILYAKKRDKTDALTALPVCRSLCRRFPLCFPGRFLLRAVRGIRFVSPTSFSRFVVGFDRFFLERCVLVSVSTPSNDVEILTVPIVSLAIVIVHLGPTTLVFACVRAIVKLAFIRVGRTLHYLFALCFEFRLGVRIVRTALQPLSVYERLCGWAPLHTLSEPSTPVPPKKVHPPSRKNSSGLSLIVFMIWPQFKFTGPSAIGISTELQDIGQTKFHKSKTEHTLAIP